MWEHLDFYSGCWKAELWSSGQWQVPHLLNHLCSSSNPFQMSFAMYDGLFTLPAGGFSFQFESQGLILPGPVVGRGQVSQWELQAGLCLYSVSGMSFPRQQLLLCLALVSEPPALSMWGSNSYRKPCQGTRTRALSVGCRQNCGHAGTRGFCLS